MSEEKFRRNFQGSLIGMSLTDSSGRYLEVNDAFCRMLGCTQKELTQMTFQEITFPDDLESNLTLYQKALACAPRICSWVGFGLCALGAIKR